MEKVVLHNHTAEDAFDCLTELIKIMTYDVENGGMREAGLKQLEYIRQEYSKLERENCGLNQTVLNLRKRVAVSYTHLTLPTNSKMCRSRWSPYH